MIKEIQNFNESVANKNATNDIISSVPKKVFIVPYRNRVHHKFFFVNT